MNKCDCYISNKYQLISNEGINHFTLDELMRLVNRLKVNRSFVYTVSNLAELNEIFKYYPTKAQTIEILGGATDIVPVAQNLTDDSIDYAWSEYYTKEEVIAFINAGFIPEIPAKTYVFTVNPTPATATIILNSEVRNTIVVYEGEQVIWHVEDSGFKTQMGILNVTENTTIDVVLNEDETGGDSEDPVPVYTVCIEPTPSDANVYINGVKQNCITKGEGAVATYDVLKSGYIPQSGTININADKTISVVLEVQPEKPIEYYTLTINPTPTDALVVLNGVEQNTITVEKGTIVEWSVSKLGYFSQSGSQRITEDVTLDIELIEDTTYIPNYSFCINATPADAIVKINGFTQSCLEVQEGDILTWSVVKEGYVSQSGTYVMGDSDYTIDISLEEYVPQNYTLTINPTPSDAVVTIDGEITNTITVVEGTSVSYSVEKEGYVSQSETLIINKDTTLNVSLRELGMYTFTVNPYPSYATVLIDDEIRNTITVEEGTVVTWVVSLAGYTSQAGTYKVDKDSSINVFIECMGEPQTVSTLEEYQNAGADTGIIDLCTYDLTPYTGDIRGNLNDNVEYFEGDLLSNGRIDLSGAFGSSESKLKSVFYIGETDNVLSCQDVFDHSYVLTDISGFRNLNVNNLYEAFNSCYSLSNIESLATINVSDVESFYSLFDSCYSITDISPVYNWNTSSLLSSVQAFQSTRIRVADLVNWDISNVTDMYGMFGACCWLKKVRFGGDCNPNVDCSYMFNINYSTMFSIEGGTLYYPCQYAQNYTNIINAIPPTWTAICYNSLDECDMSVDMCEPIPVVISWDTDDEYYENNLRNVGYSVYNAEKGATLKKIDMCHYDLTPYIQPLSYQPLDYKEDLHSFFSEDLMSFEGDLLSNGRIDLSGAFAMLYNLEEIKYIGEGRPTNMKYFASECSSLRDISGLRGLDTSLVTDMSHAFCNSHDTETVYANCTLEDISPIYEWDTSNVTNMKDMFRACCGLEKVDLSKWDISNVTDMSNMFMMCIDLNELRFGGDCNPSVNCDSMFYMGGWEHEGTLYYPAEYASSYANIIAEIPSTWTAVAY